MTRDAKRYVTSAAAGVVTGSLAFMAVRSLSNRHRFSRSTKAKALKILGTFMDSI